jgi:hypothetical protein
MRSTIKSQLADHYGWYAWPVVILAGALVGAGVIPVWAGFGIAILVGVFEVLIRRDRNGSR